MGIGRWLKDYFNRLHIDERELKRIQDNIEPTIRHMQKYYSKKTEYFTELQENSTGEKPLKALRRILALEERYNHELLSYVRRLRRVADDVHRNLIHQSADELQMVDTLGTLTGMIDYLTTYFREYEEIISEQMKIVAAISRGKRHFRQYAREQGVADLNETFSQEGKKLLLVERAYSGRYEAQLEQLNSTFQRVGKVKNSVRIGTLTATSWFLGGWALASILLVIFEKYFLSKLHMHKEFEKAKEHLLND